MNEGAEMRERRQMARGNGEVDKMRGKRERERKGGVNAARLVWGEEGKLEDWARDEGKEGTGERWRKVEAGKRKQ